MRYEQDFIGAVKVRQAEISASLVAGHPATYEAYQRLVGQYAGLEEALQLLLSMIRQDETREL
jgi:hypothetical protein